MSEKKEINTQSTFDRLMQDPDFKKEFEAGYREFVISEMVLAMMANDKVSVRKLAKMANVSPKLIQDVRSGKERSITLRNFFKIIDSLGYKVIVKKGKKEMLLKA